MFIVLRSRAPLTAATSLRLILLLAWVLASQSAGFAQESQTDLSPDSDESGNTVTLRCGDSEALVGIAGKSGIYIDQVQAICAQIKGGAAVVGLGDERRVGSAGGNTLASAFTLKCPSGKVITHIAGVSGQWLDGFGVSCGNFDERGRWKGSSSFESRTGGTRNLLSTEFNLGCTDNKLATGLRVAVRSDQPYVQRIGLICNYPLLMTEFRTDGEVSNSSTPQYSSGSKVRAVVSFNRAPASPATITPSSSDTSVATVPSQVTATESAKAFDITTQGTAQTERGVEITARFGSDSRTKRIAVRPIRVARISFSSQQIVSGSSATATVHLDTPAPAGEADFAQPNRQAVGAGLSTVAGPPIQAGRGVLVLLSSSLRVSVPSSVRIPLGQTTANFNVTANGAGCESISARTETTPDAAAARVSILVEPEPTPAGSPVVLSLSSSTGTVTLSEPAPQGGVTILLNSSDGAVSVPSSITIAEQTRSNTFPITVNQPWGCSVITASKVSQPTGQSRKLFRVN